MPPDVPSKTLLEVWHHRVMPTLAAWQGVSDWWYTHWLKPYGGWEWVFTVGLADGSGVALAMALVPVLPPGWRILPAMTHRHYVRVAVEEAQAPCP